MFDHTPHDDARLPGERPFTERRRLLAHTKTLINMNEKSGTLRIKLSYRFPALRVRFRLLIVEELSPRTSYKAALWQAWLVFRRSSCYPPGTYAIQMVLAVVILIVNSRTLPVFYIRSSLPLAPYRHRRAAMCVRTSVAGEA